jgi:predicted RNase H-like HicB family nuclease
MMSNPYLVVIEPGGTNYSAYVPDLPGCVSTGQTVEETIHNIKEAIEGHIEAMREDGDPIPAPTTHHVDDVVPGDIETWIEVAPVPVP